MNDGTKEAVDKEEKFMMSIRGIFHTIFRRKEKYFSKSNEVKP